LSIAPKPPLRHRAHVEMVAFAIKNAKHDNQVDQSVMNHQPRPHPCR